MGSHFDRAVFLGTALHQAANIILNIIFCFKKSQKNQEHSLILIQLGQKNLDLKVDEHECFIFKVRARIFLIIFSSKPRLLTIANEKSK